MASLKKFLKQSFQSLADAPRNIALELERSAERVAQEAERNKAAVATAAATTLGMFLVPGVGGVAGATLTGGAALGKGLVAGGTVALSKATLKPDGSVELQADSIGDIFGNLQAPGIPGEERSGTVIPKNLLPSEVPGISSLPLPKKESPVPTWVIVAGVVIGLLWFFFWR